MKREFNDSTEVRGANLQIPDHHHNQVGVGNINRVFYQSDNSNGPQVAVRAVVPFDALWAGFSKLGTISDQDTGSLTDVNNAYTDTMTPITQAAIALDTTVYPVFQNIFASGTGSRAGVSMTQFARYFAMVSKAYTYLYTILQLNALTYHYDWSKVYPFSDRVPTYMFDAALAYDATDVGLAERWLPLLKRLETHILFPAIVEETKRMLAPMLSVDLNGRLLLPMRINIWNTTLTVSDVETLITGWLDFLDSNLSAQTAVIRSFLPFPLVASDPWSIPQEPVIDVDRATGWYNSAVVASSVFGDTGDPQNKINLKFDKDFSSPDRTYFYSRNPQPVWGELRLSTVYNLNYHITDNTFDMLTLHQQTDIALPTDDDNALIYDDTNYASTTESERYEQFAHCRWVDGANDLTDGKMSPGMTGAEIINSSAERLLRLDVENLFALTAMKAVAIRAAGASLRELRVQIAETVNDNLSGGALS